MANWVYTSGQVSGDTETIKQMATQVELEVKDYADSEVEFVDDDNIPQGTSIVLIRFATKWQVPKELYETLASTYPSLEWDWEYEEETGWGGKIVFKQGEVVENSFYDVPESHADYDALDRECFGCNSGDLFDDCPTDEEINNG
jgi:hypothetical protein